MTFINIYNHTLPCHIFHDLSLSLDNKNNHYKVTPVLICKVPLTRYSTILNVIYLITFLLKTLFFTHFVIFSLLFVLILINCIRQRLLLRMPPKKCLIPSSIVTDFKRVSIAWPFHMWLRPFHSVGLRCYPSFSCNHKFGILYLINQPYQSTFTD